jgi:hypothetical protein
MRKDGLSDIHGMIGDVRLVVIVEEGVHSAAPRINRASCARRESTALR